MYKISAWKEFFFEQGTAGVPLSDENNGRQIAMRLLAGDDEKAVAKKLTLQQYRARTGTRWPALAGPSVIRRAFIEQ
jgi:hypothetical protein